MKTPLTYYGGKQRLIKHILPLIPAHDLYAEPFCGGAAVFWAKAAAPIEVLNDQNRAMVTFWQVLQHEPEALAARIQRTPHSRSLYKDSMVIYGAPHLFSRVDLAWAVWVQTQMTFLSSIGNGFAFSKSPSANGRDSVNLAINNKRKRYLAEDLMAMKDRLQGVQLECGDALRIIKTRDTERSFFYLDPPYPGTNMGHYEGYSDRDFADLLLAAKAIKGKFLLSCYPNELLRQTAHQEGWTLEALSQPLSASKVDQKGERKRKTEVLVRNY